MNFRVLYLSLLFGLFALAPLTPSGARAQVLLDPSSGSYFELISDRRVFGRKSTAGSKWFSAREFAESRFYEGRRGHLASIKTRDTHKFITQNFQIRANTWIGLRYMCANRSLVWTNGERLDRSSDFQAWHPKWLRGLAGGGTTCASGRNSYLPVYYIASEVPRWQASGPDKGFSALLIEYPSQ